MEEECSLCKGRGIVLKLSYIEGLIKNEIIRMKEENSIESFYIEVDSVYKERVKEDVFSFLKEIDALGNDIYLNYVDGIDGYKIEPLLFQNQKDNLKDYILRNIKRFCFTKNYDYDKMAFVDRSHKVLIYKQS